MNIKLTIGIILMNWICIGVIGQKQIESIENLLAANHKSNSYDIMLLKIGLNVVSESQYKYGIQEQLFTYKKNRHQKSVKLALLKLKLKDDEFLLYYEIFEEVKEKTVCSTFYDSVNIKTIYNRIKNDEISLLNIDEELTYGRLDSDILGYACGFSASTPYFGKLLLPIIERKDLDELFKWLSSVNPTKQAYGYIGIKVLTNNGEMLSDSQKVELEYFMNDKINKYYYVKTCSGCVYDESYSLQELPDTEFLKTLISLYSNSDWR